LSFIFTALLTDYLPLLSSIATDRRRTNEVVNSQLAIATLVAAPPTLVLIAASGPAVALIYSSAFHKTAALLRIMLLGETTRVAAWTVGYVLVARRVRTLFVLTEILYLGVAVSVTALLIKPLGVNGAAWAYVIAQVGSLAWTLVFVRHISGFRLSVRSWQILAGVAVGLVATYLCAASGGWWGVGAWVVTVIGSLIATSTVAHLSGRTFGDSVRRGLRWAISVVREE
jgi:PST family polysaccharide transporter